MRDAFAATRPALRCAAAFAAIAALLVLLPSWYMLEVYDRVLGSRSHTTLVMLTVLAVAGYALMEVLDWVAGGLLQHAGMQLEARLAPRAFDAGVGQALRGTRGSRLQALDDLRLLRDFIPGPAVRAALELPVALAFLLVLLAVHPLLAGLTFAAAIGQAFIAWANERQTRAPLEAAAGSAREAQLAADMALRNVEAAAAMGMLPALQKRWQQRQDAFLAGQAGASVHAGHWQAAARFVQTALGSALVGVAAWLFLRGELGAGGGWLVGASLVGARVLAPLAALVAQWRTVVAAREAWNRLDRVLAAFPQRTPSLPLPRPAGRLSAENLVVPVPGTAVPLLKGISFSLAPGEALAVVGASGSGKSSLARTLVGLWPSMGGKARLDGVDVHAWDKAELGPHIGYLPQSVELLDGTVAENIARFGPVQQEALEAAARQVGLHEWILSLPRGYDTQVGADGRRLSGGQRQRIALARALYGAPAFVVLDEPNASLDTEGDAALAQAIGAGKAAGTSFVVMTHRSGVLALCDRMLVLADGQVQAFGLRDEVLAVLERAAQPRQVKPPATRAEPQPTEPSR